MLRATEDRGQGRGQGREPALGPHQYPSGELSGRGTSMFMPTRRQTLALSAGSLIAGLIGPRGRANAATGDTLTIAYNVNLPAFDPTVGPSAVNPTIQAIYRSVFDQHIRQT